LKALTLTVNRAVIFEGEQRRALPVPAGEIAPEDEDIHSGSIPSLTAAQIHAEIAARFIRPSIDLRSSSTFSPSQAGPAIHCRR
jgi:hypothetical protein